MAAIFFWGCEIGNIKAFHAVSHAVGGIGGISLAADAAGVLTRGGVKDAVPDADSVASALQGKLKKHLGVGGVGDVYCHHLHVPPHAAVEDPLGHGGGLHLANADEADMTRCGGVGNIQDLHAVLTAADEGISLPQGNSRGVFHRAEMG